MSLLQEKSFQIEFKNIHLHSHLPTHSLLYLHPPSTHPSLNPEVDPKAALRPSSSLILPQSEAVLIVPGSCRRHIYPCIW